MKINTHHHSRQMWINLRLPTTKEGRQVKMNQEGSLALAQPSPPWHRLPPTVFWVVTSLTSVKLLLLGFALLRRQVPSKPHPQSSAMYVTRTRKIKTYAGSVMT